MAIVGTVSGITVSASIVVTKSPDAEITAAMMRQATQHAEVGEWDAACATLATVKQRMIVSGDHQTTEAWCKYPLYLSRAGRFAEAMAEFDWLLADLPRRARIESYLDDPDSFLGKGITKKGLYSKIIKSATRAIEEKRAVAQRRKGK